MAVKGNIKGNTKQKTKPARNSDRGIQPGPAGA
jgi:hypothetical protein